ncbi:MAG: hypothetical protein LBR15_03895 [Methanobrevibacter sp.]|jgi:hypothetical protein|nr:hypothetical protein [Candidatus Methanovirga australis]
MNTKVVLSLVTLGILMVSSLGSVSANEIGLWMSAMNDPGSHGSRNYLYIDSAVAIFKDNYGNEQELPLHYDAKQDIYEYNNRGVYLTYKWCPGDIIGARVEFDLRRFSGGNGCDKTYSRCLNFNMTLPVADNHWICGISRYAGGTGMYFTADNHYPKPNEVKMDTVHCFFNDREAWKAPGGKLHEPQTWSVEFPNGNDWT